MRVRCVASLVGADGDVPRPSGFWLRQVGGLTRLRTDCHWLSRADHVPRHRWQHSWPGGDGHPEKLNASAPPTDAATAAMAHRASIGSNWSVAIDWTTLGASVITLAGVLLTLLFTGAREDRHAHRARSWDNESWAREQRLAAHLKVLQTHRELRHSVIMRHRVGGGAVEPDSGPIPQWIEPLGAALLPVRVFGSPQSVSAADRLFLTTLQAERDGAPLGHLTRMNDALEEYRRAVQADLGLSVTELIEEAVEEPWQEPHVEPDCFSSSCSGGNVVWQDQVIVGRDVFVAGPCATCGEWSVRCPGCGTQGLFESGSLGCAGCALTFTLNDDRVEIMAN